MKIIERLKICGNRVVSEKLKVTNIEKLEVQNQKMRNVLDNSVSELNRLKAENIVLKGEIREGKEKSEEIIKLCKSKKDLLSEDELQKIYFAYEKHNNELENKEKIYKLNKKLLEQCQSQVDLYREKISNVEKNISILKVKENYAQNVKNFKKIAKDLKIKDVEEIARDIDIDFTAAELEINNIKNEGSLERIIQENKKENGFNAFIEKINK